MMFKLFNMSCMGHYESESDLEREMTTEIMDIDDLLDDEGWDILNSLTEEELEQLNNDFDPENSLLPVVERADHMRPINAAPMYTKEDLLGNLEKMVAKSKPVIKNENLRKKEEERIRKRELELDQKYLKKPSVIKNEMPKHIKLTKEEEELLNEATEEELIEAAEHALQQGDDDLREKILFVLEQRKIEEERAYSIIDSKLFPTIPQPKPIQTIGESSPSCLIDDDEENESLFKPMSHKKSSILDNNNNILLQKRFSHLAAYQDDSSSCFDSEDNRNNNTKQRPKSKPRRFSKDNSLTKNTCIERVKLFNEDKIVKREKERKRKSRRRKNSVNMKIEHLKILKEKTSKEETNMTDESDLTIQEETTCETESNLSSHQSLEEIQSKNVQDDQTPIKVNCNVSVNTPVDKDIIEEEKKTSDEVIIHVNIDINLEDHLIGQLAKTREIELETDISETLSESFVDHENVSLTNKKGTVLKDKEKLYKRNDLELKYNVESDDNVSKMIQDIKNKKAARKRTNSISKNVESSSYDKTSSTTPVKQEESTTTSKIKQLQERANRRNSKTNISTEKPQVKGKLNIAMPNLDSNNSASSANEKSKKRPSKLAFNEKNPFAKFIKKDDNAISKESQKTTESALISKKNNLDVKIENEIIAQNVTLTENQPNKLDSSNKELIESNLTVKPKNDDDNDSGIDRSHSVFSMYTPTDLDSRLDMESTTSENLNDTFQMSDDTEKPNETSAIEKPSNHHTNVLHEDKATEGVPNKSTASVTSKTKNVSPNGKQNNSSISSKIRSNREKNILNNSMKKQRSIEKTEKNSSFYQEENLHNVSAKFSKSKEKLIKKNSNEKVNAILNGKVDLSQEQQVEQTFKRVKTRRSRRSSKSKIQHSSDTNNISTVETTHDTVSEASHDDGKNDETATSADDTTSISTENLSKSVSDDEVLVDATISNFNKSTETIQETSESLKKSEQLTSIKSSDQTQDNVKKLRIRKKSDPFRILNKVKHFNSLYTANTLQSIENVKLLRNDEHLECAEFKSDRTDVTKSNNKHSITSIDNKLLSNDNIDGDNIKLEKIKINDNGKFLNQEKVIAAANQNLADILREKKKSLKNQKKSRKVSIEDKLQRIRDLSKQSKSELEHLKASDKELDVEHLSKEHFSVENNSTEKVKEALPKSKRANNIAVTSLNNTDVKEETGKFLEEKKKLKSDDNKQNSKSKSQISSKNQSEKEKSKKSPLSESPKQQTNKTKSSVRENRRNKTIKSEHEQSTDSEKSKTIISSAEKTEVSKQEGSSSKVSISEKEKLTSSKTTSTAKSQIIKTSIEKENPKNSDDNYKPLSIETESKATTEKTQRNRISSPIANKKEVKPAKEDTQKTSSQESKIKNLTSTKDKVDDKTAGVGIKRDKTDETKRSLTLKKKSEETKSDRNSKTKVTSPFGVIKLKSVSKSKKMGVVDSLKSQESKTQKQNAENNLQFLENNQDLTETNNFSNSTKSTDMINDVVKSLDNVDHALKDSDRNLLDENNNNMPTDNKESTLINKQCTDDDKELSYFARRKRERQKELEAEELENKNPFVCDEPEVPTLSIPRFYKPQSNDDDDDDDDDDNLKTDTNAPITTDLDSNYFANRRKARENRVFLADSPEPLKDLEDFDELECEVDTTRSSPTNETIETKHNEENVPTPDMASNKKSNKLLEKLKKHKEKNGSDIEVETEKQETKNLLEQQSTYEEAKNSQSKTIEALHESKTTETLDDLTDEQRHIINLKLEKEREVQRLLAEIAKMNASLEIPTEISLSNTTSFSQTENKNFHEHVIPSPSSPTPIHKHTDTSILKNERNATHEQKRLETRSNTNIHNKNKLSPTSEKKTLNNNSKQNINNKDTQKQQILSPLYDRRSKPSSQASSTTSSPLLERKLRPVHSTSEINKLNVPNKTDIGKKDLGIKGSTSPLLEKKLRPVQSTSALSKFNTPNDNNTKEAGLKALEDIRSKLRKVPKIERKESESDDDVTVEEDVSKKRRKMIEEVNGDNKPPRKSALELLLEKDAKGLDAKRDEKRKENEEKVDVRGVTAALLQNALLKMNGMLTNEQINSVFAGETPKGASITSKTSVKATPTKHRPVMKQDEETELDVVALMKCLKEDTDDLFYICINNQPKLEKNILKEVFKSVESSKKVKHLSLAMVGIVDADAKELAKALRYNKQLETLNLESNVIGMAGIDALMKVVGNHPTLREVKVSNQKQPFGGNGEECMAAAIDKNENILKFGYSFTNPGPRNKADRAIIRHNENLRQKRRQGEDVYDLKAACKIRDPWPQPWIKIKGRRLLGGLIENKASEMGRKIDVESDIGRESRGPKLRDQEAKPFDINALLQNRKEKLKGSKIADIEEIQEEKRRKRFLELQEEARKAKEGDKKPEVDSGSTEVTPPVEEEPKSKKSSIGSGKPIASLEEEEKTVRRRKYTGEEDQEDGALDFSAFEKKPEPLKPEPVKIASLNNDEQVPRRRRKPRHEHEEEELDLSAFEKNKAEETPEAEDKSEQEKEKPEEKLQEKRAPVKIAALDTPDDGIRRRRKVTHEEDEDSGVDFNAFEKEAKKKEEEAKKEQLKEKIKKVSISSDDDKPMRRRRKKYDEEQEDGAIDFSTFEKPKPKEVEPAEQTPVEQEESEVKEDDKQTKEEAPVERKKKLSREGGKQIVADFGDAEKVPRRRMKERMYSVDQPKLEVDEPEEKMKKEEEKPKKVSITEKAKPIAALTPSDDVIPRRRRPRHHDDSDEEIDIFANLPSSVAKLPSPEAKPKWKTHHDDDTDNEKLDVEKIAAEQKAEEERKKREAEEQAEKEKQKKIEEERARLADIESRKKKLSLEGGKKIASLDTTNEQPVIRRRRKKYDDEESEDDFWKSQTQITKQEPEKKEENVPKEEEKAPEKEVEKVKEPEPEPTKEEESKDKEEPEERKKKLSREGGLKIASLPSFDDPVPRRRRKTKDQDDDVEENPFFTKKDETTPSKQESSVKKEKEQEKPVEEKPKRILGGAKIVADLPPTEEVAAVRRKKKVSFEDERKDFENPIDAFAKSEQNKIANASKKIKGLEPVDTGVKPIRRRNRYKEEDEEEKYDPFADVEKSEEKSNEKWYTDHETKHGDRRYEEKKSENTIDIFGSNNDDDDEKPKKLSLRERMARRGR